MATPRDEAFVDAAVAMVFAAYPKSLRAKLLALRRLIFATAAATDGVGPLQETLKWGQPSYLTSASKSGTTIRIDRVGSTPGRYAMYVHCQTKLVETFRAQYPDTLKYEGNRAILFDAADKVPKAAVRHCIAVALTYRLTKARRQS